MDNPPLAPGFPLPDHSLQEVLESLGIKLFLRERSLAQYVVWAAQTGLISYLDEHGPASAEEVSRNSSLTVAGADSLLGVMCALRFVSRSDAGYDLRPVAREYFLRRSPFCIIQHIEAAGFPIPRPYLRQHSDGIITRLKLRLLAMTPGLRYGSMSRLLNQHARNLGACAAAVRTGEFAGVRVMLDIAGGSGTFSIPLALDYPDMRIILTDVPAALPGARDLIAANGVAGRVSLRPLDALRHPWNLPECDGMFIGNFLHGFDDAVCLDILKAAFGQLSHGGRVWIHEMLWNDNRDGPLLTALWHAAMRSAGPGRQRTRHQLSQLLEAAGFLNIRTVPTSGAYALVTARKVAGEPPT